MKEKTLAMILKGYPRISETFIANEIRLLEQQGFNIHIISMRKPREDFSHPWIKEIKAKVTYLPSRLGFKTIDMLFYLFKAAAHNPKGALKATSLALKRFFKTRKVATIKHLLQAGYIAGKLLPHVNITHFHAHFAHSPTSVARFASVLTGLPFSFTGHAKDVWTQNPSSLTEKLHEAKFAVTCTGFNLDYLSKLKGTDSDLYRVYHGIDVRQFSSSNGSKPKSPYTVITVARLTAKKGLDTVFMALRVLRDEGFDFRYRLIGDGDDREKLLTMIEEFGLGDVTTWLGTKPHDEVVRELDKADVFAVGCRILDNGDRDGIPNVLAESMAMGLPVVATTVSAIPELVEDGKTGMLVPPENPWALARAIKRLCTEPELRDEIIPAALEKVRNDFDNQDMIQELADIYRSYGLCK